MAVGIEGLTPATAMNTAINFAVGDTLHNSMIYPTTDNSILVMRQVKRKRHDE